MAAFAKKLSSSSRLALSILALWLNSCAPQREFVRFEDAGHFHAGSPQRERPASRPEGEYDSYELIDHGAPNHGIAPMYQGQQQAYQQSGYGGGYPQMLDAYDPYGNPQQVVIPNPW